MVTASMFRTEIQLWQFGLCAIHLHKLKLPRAIHSYPATHMISEPESNFTLLSLRHPIRVFRLRDPLLNAHEKDNSLTYIHLAPTPGTMGLAVENVSCRFAFPMVTQ